MLKSVFSEQAQTAMRDLHTRKGAIGPTYDASNDVTFADMAEVILNERPELRNRTPEFLCNNVPGKSFEIMGDGGSSTEYTPAEYYRGIVAFGDVVVQWPYNAYVSQNYYQAAAVLSHVTAKDLDNRIAVPKVVYTGQEMPFYISSRTAGQQLDFAVDAIGDPWKFYKDTTYKVAHENIQHGLGQVSAGFGMATRDIVADVVPAQLVGRRKSFRDPKDIMALLDNDNVRKVFADTMPRVQEVVEEYHDSRMRRGNTLYHGDFHNGHVMVTGRDVDIRLSGVIDFSHINVGPQEHDPLLQSRQAVESYIAAGGPDIRRDLALYKAACVVQDACSPSLCGRTPASIVKLFNDLCDRAASYPVVSVERRAVVPAVASAPAR